MEDSTFLQLVIIVVFGYAFPTAIKQDHYIAVLIWLVFILGIFN